VTEHGYRTITIQTEKSPLDWLIQAIGVNVLNTRAN